MSKVRKFNEPWWETFRSALLLVVLLAALVLAWVALGSPWEVLP